MDAPPIIDRFIVGLLVRVHKPAATSGSWPPLHIHTSPLSSMNNVWIRQQGRPMRERSHTKHRGCGCVLVVVWLVLTGGLMILLRSCLFDGGYDYAYEDSWETSYSRESYYDSNNFWQENGRSFYEGEGGAVGLTGVDVSAYQTDIDWQAVAADGIGFAMIRIGWRGITDGYLHEDICFEQNYYGAQAAGLPCGVYFFSQATSVDEAREEAELALNLLAGRELSYPVVFDYEPNDGHRLSGIDRATATACARTFCDVIAAGGYRPMIYGNRYDLQHLDTSELSDIRLWFAEYASAPSYEAPFALWQYTASGTVTGIETPVDLNLDLSAAIEPTDESVGTE